MISFQRLFESFMHAFRGISTALEQEQSFRVQVIIAFFVSLAAFYFDLSRWEWIVISFLIGSVLTLELINSVFERLSDMVKPRLHPLVRELKDIMAAAVFLVSLLSLFVGGLIFWPYVHTLAITHLQDIL